MGRLKQANDFAYSHVSSGGFFQKEISLFVLETLVISSKEISAGPFKWNPRLQNDGSARTRKDIIARSESDYK